MDWMGNIYLADFLGPHVIFGHIGEPPERPQTPGAGDGPPDFLHYLAVERLKRRFTKVNATARELNIGLGAQLGSQQKPPLKGQDRIDTGA